MYDIEVLRRDPVSRRSFFTRMSAAGLGACAVSLLAGCSGSSNNNSGNNQGGLTQIDPTNFPNVLGRSENEVVLNYALTLETLEADLYRQGLNASLGLPLGNALLGSPSAYPTSAKNNGTLSGTLATAAYVYLLQFAFVEAAHRDFLSTALGADASPIIPASGKYKFATADGTPGTDLVTILKSILPLEETGVRAYLGAAPFITDNTTLQTAGTIYSTEARHSAAIEYILGIDPGPTPSRNIAGVPTPDQEVATGVATNVFEKFLSPSAVLTAASGAFFV